MPAMGFERNACARSIALLVSACRLSLAQIYEFKNLPLPDPNSLESKRVFFVYSRADAPGDSDDWPTVEFRNLAARLPPSHEGESPSEGGIVVALVPYKDFWTLIAPTRLCTVLQDEPADRAGQLHWSTPPGTSPRDANVYSYTVRFGDPSGSQSFAIRGTGAYLLTVSNCGLSTGATIGGSVVVKNSYGFLPGNEYHKKAFYGWLAQCYAGLSIASVAYLQLGWSVQGLIASLVVISLAEMCCWWLYYNNWNESGVRDHILGMIATLVSSCKSIFAYMSILVVGKRWPFSHPELDTQLVLRVQTLSFAYIVLALLRESLLSFWQSHSVSARYIFLVLAFASALNVMIFCHISAALSGLVASLQKSGQSEPALLFQRLRKLLSGCLAMGALNVFGQIVAHLLGPMGGWHYQWFLADGSSHILFLLACVVVMYLWLRQESTAYAYVRVAQEVSASLDCEDEGGNAERKPSASTNGRRTAVAVPAPDTIGATE